MSYRRANGLLLVAIAFLLCAFVAFLLYHQNFFGSSEVLVRMAAPVGEKNVVEAPLLVSSTVLTSNKILKNFGSCGDEGKNDVILSYASDLVNALLDNINDVHCEAPKPDFPNYSFILQDPSQVRIAEMTPDYQYIFYLKVQTTDVSSTYFLYKTETASRRTTLLDTYAISNDWPLQKDFYEDKLMPRESADGQSGTYFWFTSDPKGRSDTTQYLSPKNISLQSAP